MEFVKWILLPALCALTESAPPMPNQPPSDLRDTQELNNVFSEIFNSPPSYQPGIIHPKYERYSVEYLKTPSQHEKLFNVTMISTMFLQHILVIFDDNGTVKLFASKSAFVEACLQGFNHHIATEKFTITYMAKLTAQNEPSTDLKIDQNFKLNATNYQYNPDEEAQIKNEIETYIKHGVNETIEEGEASLIRITLQDMFGKILNNKQERYYYIGSILSTNYTLNNVTVYGLWNLKSISYNISHLQPLPELELGGVKGWMVQNHASSSDKLYFNADNIYISLDQNIPKVNVKLEAYSVVNAKSNTSLTNDQSKFIIEDIESAFAASVESAWKRSKGYVQLVFKKMLKN